MGRAFVIASTQYLEAATGGGLGHPLSMGCWFRSTSQTAGQTLIVVGNTSGNDFWVLTAAGNVAGDPIRATIVAGGAATNTNTTTGYTAGTWHHALAVFTSATSRDVYIDGGSVGTNATSRAPATPDVIAVGRNSASGTLAYMAGDIAEVAIWSGSLTADDALALARGVSPLMVRPDVLSLYAPLLSRASPEPDLMGLAALTLGNAPAVSDHPRIYYPSAPMVPFHAVAAPGGGRIWRLAGVGGGLVGPRGGLVAA